MIALEATFSGRYLVRIKSLTSSKLGHVGSKARSLGEMLEKTLCTL